MRYQSTRGGIEGISFEDALTANYAKDGGMLIPEKIPHLKKSTILQWSKLSYPAIVKEIATLFVPEEEIPKNHLDELIDKAFSRFTETDVVCMARLKGDLNILELFHGPTLAFKDLAMSCVGQFLEYFLEKRKKHITILVVTSGDTGSAAIESVKDLKWVDIVVLLPRGRCTKIQELQMTTVIEDNVHVYRVDGTSDDLDEPIKRCFTDLSFSQQHNLCSINAINWTRVMVQIAHYFYAYFQLSPDCDREVEVVVPTGACGNVTGGCIARMMGLPIKLVCTVNTNDIIARTLTDGNFCPASEVIQSLAPAMDIKVPYNVERMLYLFSGMDAVQVKKLMLCFEQEGKMEIPSELLNKIQAVVSTYVVDDTGICTTMKRCWQENEYLVCPHTAIAATYHYDALDRNAAPLPRVCLATASPAKFEEAVLKAGLTPQPTTEIRKLNSKPTRYIDMNKGEDWENILREKIDEISRRS